MRNSSLYFILLFSLVSCDRLTSAASGSPGAASGAPRQHTIQEGETLYSIAAQVYGDPLEWITIRNANPWADPETLLPGDKLAIPPKHGHTMAFDPNALEMDTQDPYGPQTSANPSTGSSGGANDGGGLMGKVTNIFSNIGGGQLFGEQVPQLGALALGGFLAHGFVQGFLLWIIATISFVKDVSLKKSLKTAFHTEVITLFTVLILGSVAVLMIHIGTSAPGATGPNLTQTIETYVRHPVGMVISGFLVFGLYLMLCLRFIPPAFGLKRAQSTSMIFLGVLMPHLAALYTVGQRLGLIGA